MFRLATFFALVASAALYIATPILKRELGGVLICQGPNAMGKCIYQVYEMDTCYNLTSEFSKNASTFAPDGEAFYCYPYLNSCGEVCTSPTGCTFGAVNYTYPSKDDLSNIGWDKFITSFECHLDSE